MFSGDLPSPSAGWNMKACEMNAAFGLAQLKKLEHFKADGWGRLGRHLRIGFWRSCRKITRKQDEMKKFLRNTMESKRGFKVYSMYFGLVSFVLFYYGACFNI